MKLWKITGVFLLVAACFAGGLYGAPLARATYARLFPEAPYASGDYSSLYAQAGGTVVLFSTSTCPYCRQAREVFAKRRVKYVDYVIDTSTDANDRFNALGGGAVPLIYIGTRRIRGFREPVIDEALAALAAPAASS